MGRFEEYVSRRDEVSFNPAEYLPSRIAHSPSALHVAGSALGAIPAAVSGVGQIWPALKQGWLGNPYSSGDKTVYYKAFEQGRDWLLNFARSNPKLNIGKMPIVPYLVSVIDEAEKYLRKGGTPEIAGVTMGKQGSAESIMASPFVALGRSIAASLTNLRDTLDFSQKYHRIPEEVDKIGPNIEKMLLGLDMIKRAETEEEKLGKWSPEERVSALDRLEEFKHVLQAGGHSGHIDAHGRVATQHPQFLFGEPK